MNDLLFKEEIEKEKGEKTIIIRAGTFFFVSLRANGDFAKKKFYERERRNDNKK